eukprot:gene3033-5043_t
MQTLQGSTPIRSRKNRKNGIKRKINETFESKEEPKTKKIKEISTDETPLKNLKNVKTIQRVKETNPFLMEQKDLYVLQENTTIENQPKMKLQEKIRRLAKAREQLSRSLSPETIFGRENETETISEIISNGIFTRKGKGLLVTGRPGTGKTLVINTILKKVSDENCQRIYINCMDLTTPKNLYKRLASEVKSKKEKNFDDSMESFLEDLFIGSNNLDQYEDLDKEEEDINSKKIYILILDEIERLLQKQKKNDVLENLFSWSSDENSSLILIGIANMSDLSSKIGMKFFNEDIHHVSFLPYSSKQFELILKERLNSSGIEHMFDGAAVKFIARKLESEGDARKLLDVSKKAVDLLLSGKIEKVTMKTVNEIFKNYVIKSIEQQISSLPTENQFLLCACVKLLDDDKIKEITIETLISYYNKLLKSKNFPVELSLSSAGIMDRCQSLVEYNMIKLNKKTKFNLSTLSLNKKKFSILY